MVIIPCSPYSPEQKGKGESWIKYMQINFVSGRTLVDEAELEEQVERLDGNFCKQKGARDDKKSAFQYFRKKKKCAAAARRNAFRLLQ
jgi:hypothetical protein